MEYAAQASFLSAGSFVSTASGHVYAGVAVGLVIEFAVAVATRTVQHAALGRSVQRVRSGAGLGRRRHTSDRWGYNNGTYAVTIQSVTVPQPLTPAGPVGYSLPPGGDGAPIPPLTSHVLHDVRLGPGQHLGSLTRPYDFLQRFGL